MPPLTPTAPTTTPSMTMGTAPLPTTKRPGAEVDDTRGEQGSCVPALFEFCRTGAERCCRVRLGLGDFWCHPQSLLETQGSHQVPSGIHHDNSRLHAQALGLHLALLQALFYACQCQTCQGAVIAPPASTTDCRGILLSGGAVVHGSGTLVASWRDHGILWRADLPTPCHTALHIATRIASYIT